MVFKTQAAVDKNKKYTYTKTWPWSLSELLLNWKILMQSLWAYWTRSWVCYSYSILELLEFGLNVCWFLGFIHCDVAECEVCARQNILEKRGHLCRAACVCVCVRPPVGPSLTMTRCDRCTSPLVSFFLSLCPSFFPSLVSKLFPFDFHSLITFFVTLTLPAKFNHSHLAHDSFTQRM